MGGIVSIPKDRMDTPSSGSEDEAGIGAVDLSDLAHELDQDEFDGPMMINGECSFQEVHFCGSDHFR